MKIEEIEERLTMKADPRMKNRPVRFQSYCCGVLFSKTNWLITSPPAQIIPAKWWSLTHYSIAVFCFFVLHIDRELVQYRVLAQFQGKREETNLRRLSAWSEGVFEERRWRHGGAFLSCEWEDRIARRKGQVECGKQPNSDGGTSKQGGVMKSGQ